jgi:hypothetical protein
MKPTTSNPLPPDNFSDSSDSMIFEATGPADTTHRPLTGKALERARADKQKLDRCLKERVEREDEASQ